MSEDKARVGRVTVPSSRRAPKLGARDRAFADQTRHRPGAIDQRGRRDVAEHAAVEHQQLAALDLGAEDARDAVGARRGRLPRAVGRVEVSGRPVVSDQAGDARVRRVPHRDAAFLAAELVGQSAFAARQHQRQRPGQNAAESARAEGDITRPHCSPSPRPR